MKIDLYCILRNEIRLLRYFFRHYDQFVNRYFIFDDQSTDGTYEFLKTIPNVTLLALEKHGIDDAYWVEEIWPQYKQYSRGSADWVFCVDADEFIYHPDLLHVLRRHHYRTDILGCLGFTMYSEDFPTTHGQIYEEVRLGLRDRWSSKCAVFNPQIDLEYGMGRHKVESYTPGARLRSKTGIRLLHYRYLGKEYFVGRDKNNLERCGVADGKRKVYNPDAKRNLPDDTRGPVFPWYEAHKTELMDCVTYA